MPLNNEIDNGSTPDALGYPGSVWTPAQALTPSLGRNRLTSSPNAVWADWWQAVPDPTFDPRTGRGLPAQNRGQYQRFPQPDPVRVIIEPTAVLRRFFAEGQWEEGTAAISFDPLQSPLTVDDLLFVRGDALPAPGLLPDGRTLTAKHTVIRGGDRVAGAGTVSSGGASVTGVGTAFTTSIAVGDCLCVGASALRVTAIASDTSLTVEAAPASPWASAAWERGFERLLYPPALALLSVLDQNRSYAPGPDVGLAPDPSYASIFPASAAAYPMLGTLVWTSATNSPAPGLGVSLIYAYRPCYQVIGHGTPAPVVRGTPLLTTTLARLHKPLTTLV